MHALVGRVRTIRQSPHFRRTIKFATVSIISTVISQTVIFLAFDVSRIASAAACAAIATAVSTVPAYYLNRYWTWAKRGKSSFWKEVFPFWAMAFIGLVLSTAAVAIAAHNSDVVSKSKVVQDIFVHFSYFITYIVLWVARYAIFNKYLFGPATHHHVIDTVAAENKPAAMASLDV